MLRTNKDVRVEFEGPNELKRLRQAYVTHVVDYVCQDRHRVFTTDMKELDERDKDRVTLNNVFEIQKDNKDDGKDMKKLDELEADKESSSESEDDKEESEAEELDETMKMQTDYLT